MRHALHPPVASTSGVETRFAHPVMDARQAQFDALVRKYSADLYRYAVWLVRDRALAEDLVQESFARAWKGLDSLREPKAAKGWLITILRRERARHFERAPPAGDSPGAGDLEKIAGFDDGQDPIETLSLRRALARLTEDYREPLLLQVIGGYSCREIGELLDLTSNTVMTRLFRARQKLRQDLEQRSEIRCSENAS